MKEPQMALTPSEIAQITRAMEDSADRSSRAAALREQRRALSTGIRRAAGFERAEADAEVVERDEETGQFVSGNAGGGLDGGSRGAPAAPPDDSNAVMNAFLRGQGADE